jgi:hypothetical protein
MGAMPYTGAATSVAEVAIPPARWESPGVVVEVGLDNGAGMSAQTTPAALLYLAGVAGVGFALVNPLVALGLPFFIVLGPPLQASFNADAENLIKALADTPLPERVVNSLRSQWPSEVAVAAPSLQLHMRIAGYGLVTRSGKRLDAFEPKEELCLVTEAQLEIAREGLPVRVESLLVSLATPSPDAPPPFCASFGRLAANDGRLLRQAIGELAEVLAAMTLNRIEVAK